MTGRIRPGPYALTDHSETGSDDMLTAVAAALTGGVSLVQYRDKGTDHVRRTQEARRLAELCREQGVPLIINDDVALAAEVGADGVHLGRDDAGVQAARDRLGEHSIIGVSCYNELARARAAVDQGADYVAFGSVFPSRTKPEAVHAPLELLSEAREILPVPICAIGGITPENARQVVAAGADLIAVVRAVWEGDPQENARELAEAFDE